MSYLIICVAILLSFNTSGYSLESDTLSIENEFIKIVVNNKDARGRFALETTLGSPESDGDNAQDLIYGKPLPWTSYTTLFIDNSAYIFGDPDRRLARRAQKEFKYLPLHHLVASDNIIHAESEFNGVHTVQKLSFFRNPNTNVNDSMLIEYVITNHDPVTHNVGVRIMLDTKLGQNDGAPFRIGNTGITHEVQLSKDDLVDYWQTFDSLISPNVIAQGLLSDLDQSLTIPDTVHLANWGSLVDVPWEANYQPQRSFIRKGESQKDTALALTYYPETLPPNATKTIRTVYGLGGVSLAKGEISAGLSAPKQIPAMSTKPFLVVGYLLNSGGYDAYNVKAHFDIPSAFKVVKGNTTVSFNVLHANEQKQLSLLLQLDSSIRQRVPIRLSISSDTFEPNSISRYINVMAPPWLFLRAPKQLVYAPPSSNIILKTSLYNPSAFPIDDISVSLAAPEPISLPHFESLVKSVSLIKPYEHQDISWAFDASSLPSQSSLSLSVTSPKSKPFHTSTAFEIHHQPDSVISLSSISQRKNGYFATITIDTSSLSANSTYDLYFSESNSQFIRFSSYPFDTTSVISQPSSVSFTPTGASSCLLLHFKLSSPHSDTFHLRSGETLIDSLILSSNTIPTKNLIGSNH